MNLDLDLDAMLRSELEWALSLPLLPYAPLSAKAVSSMLAPIAPIALPILMEELEGWYRIAVTHRGSGELWGEKSDVRIQDDRFYSTIMVPLDDTFVDFETRLLSAINDLCHRTGLPFAKVMLKLRLITRQKRQEALRDRIGIETPPKS